MDDARRLEAQGLARAKARSRWRRVATIRRRTIRGSLALFAILWAIVFAQLASGNDPVLSRSGMAEKRSAAATPANPTREPAPEAEVEFEPSSEFEFEEEPEAEAVEVEVPIVTASS